jgi:anti-sigma regulatory factor (Ser/Thr protein kinase)
MASATDTHTVSLTMPAKPEYLVLARLALSALCRLTPLEPEQVADLKLAVTESATYIMGGERRSETREGFSEGGDDQPEISYAFTIEDDRLVLEVRGDEQPTLSEEERELGRAIIQATVDENTFEPGVVRLVKKLPPSDQ